MSRKVIRFAVEDVVFEMEIEVDDGNHVLKVLSTNKIYPEPKLTFEVNDFDSIIWHRPFLNTNLYKDVSVVYPIPTIP